MTSLDISTTAIHVVSQYNEAGKTLVRAWRAGARRLLAGAASRYNGFVGERELPLVNEDLKTRMLGAQEKLGSFLADRLEIHSKRMVAVLDSIQADATSCIQSISGIVPRMEAPLGNSLLEVLDRINQPIAKVSAKIADTLAEGARKIETRALGTTVDPEGPKTVKAKARPASRSVRAASAVRKA